MSESGVTAPAGKTEWKVRVASLATFVVTAAGWMVIDAGYLDPIVDAVPDAIEPLAGALVLAASAWLAGRAAKSRPEYISRSTLEAVSRRR